ncbi:efflux RND transporter permease subunit [Siphonobacter aquaeclarae]|uniref:Multidrug efflux pump subunit AcrB n=1 Tax=Siphonobacter aquaeclarae TaxID=563176 RepID=A0A1G9YUB0_9BACT|nr:efflux RND transporter permease subunit [Siphonobacter aquaeclarae]SDN12664.1 Multidrug efflux pump subunit AcrB [Siphonobacter aquaeclarae]
MENGIAGRIASAFIQSKLTLLLLVAGVLLGVYAIFMIPREEEPQIKVPMIDIFVGYPGAGPKEVESRIAAPLEKVISNIGGVEHVYSTSMDGRAMLIVQFKVGEDIERSQVKLYTELARQMDQMPEGATMPLLKSRGIDDVPVFTVTLWGEKYADGPLREIANQVGAELKKTPEVSGVRVIGGHSRELRVVVDKEKMMALKIDLTAVRQQIEAQNSQVPAGLLRIQDTTFRIRTGNFLESAEELRNLIVGTNGQQPVFLKQFATIQEGYEKPARYVAFGYGEAEASEHQKFPSVYPAVTLAVSKRSGADAMALTATLERNLQRLEKSLIPADLKTTITRNTGESASEKVSELLLHLAIAIMAVTAFVMLAMGWRGGMVVFLSVPVTFALTLVAYYFLDYTLNRITLFALVFIVGIVVDDSIIIAENMHRHFRMKKLPFLQAAIFSINEVGNPTILATFTVMAAVFPMAFVSGMMGPYMSPMPIGAAVAMLISLIVALTVTPYLGYLFLQEKTGRANTHGTVLEETFFYRAYKRIMQPLLNSRARRWGFMVGTTVVLLATFFLFYTRSVAVKMLPFDNKNEFQVVVDLPEGATLERTNAAVTDIAAFLGTQPTVRHFQTYTGTSSPITFSGLVRHYDLRAGDNVADIQVSLTDKKDRSTKSHEITRSLRDPIRKIAARYGANVALVEVSPGPPVRSTLVAELYGPDEAVLTKLAAQVRKWLSSTPDVVDLDWSIEADEPEYRFIVDKEKAMRSGVAPAQAALTVRSFLSGATAGVWHRPENFETEPVRLQLADSSLNGFAALSDLPVKNQSGQTVPLGILGHWERTLVPKSINRKDQKRVIYLTADMAGSLESPVYAILAVSQQLASVRLPEGYFLHEEYTEAPENESEYAIKWDGEWQITYEVFRDLGIAFAAVLIIIYILIVGWFQDFKVPFVMLSAIPLSLIGIILGHWIMGAYFTATSMIGFIALAGVMVRNSILLIDFIDIRLSQGESLQQAIVEAGAVRTMPILLTAGAVVLGAVIILADPVFQGLAISLMGGTLTSTFLTLIVVPLLYFKMLKKDYVPKNGETPS